MKFNIVALILIGLFIVGYSVLGFKTMLDENKYLKESYESKNYNEMFQSVSITTPDISEISLEGSADAPLTIIVIHDFNSQESNEFYKTKIPELKSRYVDTNQARIYHKYMITREELEQKSGRYNQIQAVRCFNDLSDINSVAFHLDIISTGIQNAVNNIGIYNIDINAFNDCYNNKYYKSTYIDMLETERFSILGPSIYLGVNGKNNIVMYGNPDITEIYQNMRLREIKVGLN